MDAIHTTLGALVSGLVTSVHCVGVCGPIACGLSAMPASESERMFAATSYHGAYLTSYAIIGGICGAIGKQPLQWIFNSPAVILPWTLVLVFLVFVSGLEKRLPRPAALLKYAACWRFKTARLTPALLQQPACKLTCRNAHIEGRPSRQREPMTAFAARV